ncbi:MAG: hypothetical protein ACKVP7_04270 [Hyphomicrobiaceae bacterium]
MRRFELIWIEQCEAARRIMRDHDDVSALDYLIGEKLMVFVATAEDRVEFARELPAFVAAIRDIFGADVLHAYVDHLHRIYREGEKEAREHTELFEDGDVVSNPDEWSKEGARLDRLKELLTARQLGTS